MDIDRLKGFVHGNVIKDKEASARLRETDDWLSNGLVDSMGVVRIASFVERELETTVPEEDLTVDNFKSLKDVARYLEERKQRRGQQG